MVEGQVWFQQSEAARYLRFSVAFFRRVVHPSTVIYVERAPRYSRADLDAFMESRRNEKHHPPPRKRRQAASTATRSKKAAKYLAALQKPTTKKKAHP